MGVHRYGNIMAVVEAEDTSYVIEMSHIELSDFMQTWRCPEVIRISVYGLGRMSFG